MLSVVLRPLPLDVVFRVAVDIPVFICNKSFYEYDGDDMKVSTEKVSSFFLFLKPPSPPFLPNCNGATTRQVSFGGGNGRVTGNRSLTGFVSGPGLCLKPPVAAVRGGPLT